MGHECGTNVRNTQGKNLEKFFWTLDSPDTMSWLRAKTGQSANRGPVSTSLAISHLWVFSLKNLENGIQENDSRDTHRSEMMSPGQKGYGQS